MLGNLFRGGRQPDALRVYYLLEGASSLFFQLVFTIYVIYYARAVGLDALQIVLMGTIFEATIFLFEIPTGLVADVYSRRLSAIVGFGLIGIAWLIAGVFPTIAAILIAEILQGIGSTFTSGAVEAWISDEIGVEQAGKAFVRAAQVRTLGGMIGIALSGLLASIALNVPYLAAGALLVGLAIWLALVMPEKGFKRTPQAERSTWHSLVGTLREGIRLVRLRRALIPILVIAFIYAFHTEGFDHLWQKNLLDNFVLPGLGTLNPVVWFSIIGLGASTLSIGVQEIVRRRVNLDDATRTGRALMVVYSVTALGVLVFSLAGDFTVAIAAYWLVAALRNASDPISNAWLNQKAEPGIRATLFSMKGQISALGETVGGPPVGLVAQVVSLRAALAACGVILMLTLPFFSGVLKRNEQPAIEIAASEE